MILDLAEMEGATRPFEFTIPQGDLDLENPNFRFTGDIRTRGEISRQAAQIDVVGAIDASAEVDCTRCLEPVAQDLKIDFAASYVAPENFASDKEREVSPADLDVDVLEDDRIDMKEVVREQILLNLPEQLFCKPDCKGLCEKCGSNRNLIDCKCDSEETDPRWEALKNLRGK
jgi:uncharacterized protein